MVAVQFIALQFCVRFGGRKAEAQDFDFAQVRFVVGTVTGVDEKIARKALVTLAVGVGYGVPVAKVRQFVTIVVVRFHVRVFIVEVTVKILEFRKFHAFIVNGGGAFVNRKITKKYN